MYVCKIILFRVWMTFMTSSANIQMQI